MMDKSIYIGMIIGIFIILVSITDVISEPITFTEDQILSMNRAYIINNLNPQYEEHFIQEEFLIIVYSMNHIEKVNDTYYLQRIIYYTNMPLAVIDSCRKEYSNAVCRTYLLHSTEILDNGIEPIYYQMRNFALGEINNIFRYQYNIQLSRTTLGQDLMEGGIGTPEIE